MGERIKTSVNRSIFILISLALLSSCTFKKPDSSDASYSAIVSSGNGESTNNGNGEGFHGGNGEGFHGTIQPTIDKVYAPTKDTMKIGTRITVIGTNFGNKLEVIVSGVLCNLIKVTNSSSATCSLSEEIAAISSVSVQNPTGNKTTVINPEVVPDNDGDGIPDAIDICPGDPDPQQYINIRLGIGEACDGDFDDDGIVDYNDNCHYLGNNDQKDSDHDGIGDACDDGDRDGDGILDDLDNCLYDYNPLQTDINRDHIGDACLNPDYDEDGIFDSGIYNEVTYEFVNVDNCKYTYNLDQADSDNDGKGDACDPYPFDYDEP